MARDPRQMALFSPSAVAIHDDGHVAGNLPVNADLLKELRG
jgi:hypothetical protein